MAFSLDYIINRDHPYFIVILITLGMYFFSAYQVVHMAAPAKNGFPLFQKAFDEQYGLRVNLLAMNTASGMVDLRLKMLDVVKAKSFLQDKKYFPIL